MGLNVGGLHVRVHENLNSKKVAEEVEAYWLGLGATRSKADALEHKPLSLEKTGSLGYLVMPVFEGAEQTKESWVPVYDSERYRADPALARHLALRLETSVWYWKVSDASSHAYAKCYGGEEAELRGESVLELLDTLPECPLYFNQAREALPQEALDRCTLLSFEQIPHRPNAQYSGPSAAQLQSNDAAAIATELVQRFDAEGLPELADDRQVFFDVIERAVKGADLRVPKQLEFVCALGPTVLRYRKHSGEVAEAALRGSDEELFARATESMASYQANLLEARAFELGKAGENEIAFRLLEAITRHSSASQTVWTNALYFLQFADPSCIPSPRLEQLLERASEAGRTNAGGARSI